MEIVKWNAHRAFRLERRYHRRHRVMATEVGA